MIFRDRYETQSAGIYNDKPVTKQQLSWADTIVAMEERQQQEIADRFPRIYLQKRILVFGIPDIYAYNQPKLIDLLKSKVTYLL